MGKIKVNRGMSIITIILRLILALIVLIAFIACIGAMYQAIENWKDARRFPQKGKLIQAGEIKLNIDCSGEGKPTVILESAGAFPARAWVKVQPEVAKFARVCSYDRAGYGWSEPSLTPRTMQQEADELKLLLQAAGEDGPYVLVGHSQGGLNVRAFAHKYPVDVAGVVLVDASHPDFDKRILEVLSVKAREQYISDDRLINSELGKFLSVWMVRLGITRLVTPKADELSQEINYLSWQTKTIKAFSSEIELFEKSAEQIRASGNLGDRPLIVLTAGKVDEEIYESQADVTAVQKLWVEVLQKDLVKLSSKGKQIVIADSGHLIPQEKPEAVVSAIKEVLEQIAKVAD
jgi:pimeloyl-ACP methyl ester carboxylesterase